jgi:iron complex outermembrane receptor protein
MLEEVVVTAQKRAQSLQDVPIAITAFSQQMMQNQNIFDVLDLQRSVPSLSIIKGYNRANGVPIIIRGMGTIGTQPAFEGSVGTYVDGVYRSRPGMVLSGMLDLGQVEVLRGPQGTLFGKNTTAGAITMTTNAPEEEFGYGGEVTLGDYDRQRFVGHVTGPLNDSLLGRLALLSDQRDGYTEAVFDHDDYDDLDNWSAKGSLVWRATDAIDVKLIADYSDSDEVCCFGNPVPYNRALTQTDGALDAFNRESAQANFNTDIDLLTLDPSDRETQNNVEPGNDNTEGGAVLDINWDLGFAELRSISGYHNWQYNSKGDFDFGPVDIGLLDEDYDVDSYSQEFNLAGTFEGLGFIKTVDYVGGLYYAYEDFQQDRTFNAGPDQNDMWDLVVPVQVSQQTGVATSGEVLRTLLGGGAWATNGKPIGDVRHQLETESMAAFGHVTAALSDKLSVIAGLRYSDEEKTMDRHNRLAPTVEEYSTYLEEFMLGGWTLGANIAGPDMNDLKYDDSEWTYDLKLQYFLSDDSHLYGGYSRGFKAGGIGMDPEAGGGQPSGQNSETLLLLAGQGNGTGFADLEDPTYEPEYVDAWELGLKSDYLDGRGRANVALFYNDIEDIQFSIFTGTNFTVLNASSADITGVELENFFAVTENLRLAASVTWLDAEYGNGIPPPAESGRELTQAPDWAWTVNLEYERPITDRLAGFFNANWAYRSSHHVAYDVSDKQSSYDLVGLQAGVRTQDGRWDVRAWCDNCFDKDYATAYFNVPFYFNDNLEQYKGQFLGPPRTYGATLRMNF